MMKKSLIILPLISLISGCASNDMTDLRSFIEEVKQRPPGRIEPLPEIKEVETEKIEEVVPTEEPEPIEEVETEDKPAYRLEPHAAGYFQIIATYSDGTTKKMLKSKKRRKDAEKILEELLA